MVERESWTLSLQTSRSTMECLIGMQFEDFVMVAADQTNARSIMVMKNDQNKFFNLSDR